MRWVRPLAVLAAVAAIAAPFAAVSKAAEPAPLSQLVAQVNIPYEQFTLPNGLRVVVHTDRKAPVVAIQAWYNVGSKDEPKGRTGFAHLFEHIGLFNGTENLPRGLMEPLRAMGATDWNGTTWFDRTNFFQTVPTPALEQALYMESDRMGHLLGALSQERLDAQRGIVQNEKRQGDNQPFGLVGYAQLEALFPEGHPYRHDTIGSMADLDAASLEDVRQWHRDNYGPNNAVLVLAGDIDAATAKALVAKYFGDIPRGRQNRPAEAGVPTLPHRVDATLHDRVSFTRLYRSWAVPGVTDAEAPALDVAASVLGGLASSRLDNELVRGQQVAIAVTGGLQQHQRISIFELSVDVKPGVDPAAVSQKLDAIIADFIAHGPTADEVRRVVTSQLSQQIQQLEPTGGFTGKSVVLAEGALYANDPGFYKTALARYAALTPAAVQAAAAKWLGRPVYALRVDPGEREPYQEAAAARPAPQPAAPLPVKPRAPMPPIGDIANLDFPSVERARLSNGVEVIYARSSTVPTTRVAVEFDAGIAADPADAAGTQALLLNLMTAGTTHLNAVQIAETQERIGAQVFAFQTMDRTLVTLATVSPNLQPSLDLLADIVQNPALAPSEIERLRAQQIAGVQAEMTNPAGIGFRALPALIYGDAYPYGRPFSGTGDQAALARITRDDLFRFHQTWIRPDNARIYVVSNLPLTELTPMLDARFGRWAPPAGARGVKDFNAPIAPATPRIVLIDRPQSPQSVILAGEVLSVGGRDDLLVINAANEVLANNFLSRINQDIREARGWSYGLRGYLNTFEFRTPYVINAPVQADRTGESIAVLLEHYRRFRSDKGVTDQELNRTRLGNMRQLAGSFETSQGLINTLRSNQLYGRPDNYWETVASRYDALTAAQLDAAHRGVVDPDRLVWVVVGDASVVKPQLDRLGLPVEVRPAAR
ncbi:MAG: insulinase family protein [Caulobacteraceae bacterium]|nr:insulinase family protein [Caulobacteraceae bacterium]